MPFDEYEASGALVKYKRCEIEGGKGVKNVDRPLFVFDLGKFVRVSVCAFALYTLSPSPVIILMGTSPLVI